MFSSEARRTLLSMQWVRSCTFNHNVQCKIKAESLCKHFVSVQIWIVQFLYSHPEQLVHFSWLSLETDNNFNPVAVIHVTQHHNCVTILKAPTMAWNRQNSELRFGCEWRIKHPIWSVMPNIVALWTVYVPCIRKPVNPYAIHCAASIMKKCCTNTKYNFI